MPVLDHEVHELVRRDKFRAGCFNREGFAKGFWAQDGWEWYEQGLTKVARFVWVPHRHSTKCRQIIDLPECECCTAPKDVEYIETMKGLK